MKKYIYIGKEKGQETVVEVSMDKPGRVVHGSTASKGRKERWKLHIATAPRYIVPFPIPDHWKIGEEVQVTKQHQVNYTDGFVDEPWEDCSEEVYNDHSKSQIIPVQLVAKPIPTEVKEEFFLPPDNGDVCWEEGAQSFSRKEVFALLHTQRAMIGNDLKSQCGNELTDKMYDIINNPRIPKF